MKRVLTMPVLLLLATVPIFANGGENFPFHVGEKLSYQVFWGPFIAGHASLEVEGIEQIDGHDCYHLIARANTSGLADLLYHVESKTESWLDVSELCTRLYRETRTEGKRRVAGETHYNYIGGSTLTTNFITGKVKSSPLTAPTQDVISSLYYVRTQPLALNVNSSFPVNVSGTNYSVNIRPDARKTLYFRPLGDVTALRVEPKPTLNVVAANGGRMWLWVSDDQRKFPLLVSSDLKIGSAKLVLNSVTTANPVADKSLRPKAGAPGS